MKTHIKTKIQLAKTVGISRSTLDRYLTLPGAPHPTRKGWALDAVVHFVNEHASREETALAGNDDLRALRAREIRLRCERAQLKLDDETGKLISAAEAKGWLIAAIEKQKHLLSLKLRNELPPKL